jgi:hypothetical protein
VEVVVVMQWAGRPGPGLARCRTIEQVADVQRRIPRSRSSVGWVFADAALDTDTAGVLTAAAQQRILETCRQATASNLVADVVDRLVKLAAYSANPAETLLQREAAMRAESERRRAAEALAAAGRFSHYGPADPYVR